MILQDFENLTKENTNFRKVLVTNSLSQLVVMSIPKGQDIGEEIHEETDQLLFVIDGEAEVVIDGEISKAEEEDVIIIPKGARHNIKNYGDEDLKVLSIYTPPNHPDGTIHVTKEDAMSDE